LFETRSRSKEYRFESSCFEKFPRVIADGSQLQRVFINLTMNAVEAMIPITDRERLLVIKSAICDPASALITMKDSGAGIDPKNLDRIFDPFYTTKSDGMGMGLFICRSIIQGHGGRHWALPCQSYGSVFHVLLPASTCAQRVPSCPAGRKNSRCDPLASTNRGRNASARRRWAGGVGVSTCAVGHCGDIQAADSIDCGEPLFAAAVIARHAPSPVGSRSGRGSVRVHAAPDRRDRRMGTCGHSEPPARRHRQQRSGAPVSPLKRSPADGLT
jgi:hypothetical protein